MNSLKGLRINIIKNKSERPSELINKENQHENKSILKCIDHKNNINLNHNQNKSKEKSVSFSVNKNNNHKSNSFEQNKILSYSNSNHHQSKIQNKSQESNKSKNHRKSKSNVHYELQNQIISNIPNIQNIESHQHFNDDKTYNIDEINNEFYNLSKIDVDKIFDFPIDSLGFQKGKEQCLKYLSKFNIDFNNLVDLDFEKIRFKIEKEKLNIMFKKIFEMLNNLSSFTNKSLTIQREEFFRKTVNKLIYIEKKAQDKVKDKLNDNKYLLQDMHKLIANMEKLINLYKKVEGTNDKVDKENKIIIERIKRKKIEENKIKNNIKYYINEIRHLKYLIEDLKEANPGLENKNKNVVQGNSKYKPIKKFNTINAISINSNSNQSKVGINITYNAKNLKESKVNKMDKINKTINNVNNTFKGKNIIDISMNSLYDDKFQTHYQKTMNNFYLQNVNLIPKKNKLTVLTNSNNRTFTNKFYPNISKINRNKNKSKDNFNKNTFSYCNTQPNTFNETTITNNMTLKKSNNNFSSFKSYLKANEHMRNTFVFFHNKTQYLSKEKNDMFPLYSVTTKDSLCKESTIDENGKKRNIFMFEQNEILKSVKNAMNSAKQKYFDINSKYDNLYKINKNNIFITYYGLSNEIGYRKIFVDKLCDDEKINEIYEHNITEKPVWFDDENILQGIHKDE